VKGICWIRATSDTQVKVGAWSDAFLATITLFCSAYHMHEMSGESASTDRSAAYIDEATNMCNTFNRYAQAAIKLTEDPDSKAAAALVAAGFSVAAGSLEFANAGMIGSS
jgi:hypothetical protein